MAASIEIQSKSQGTTVQSSIPYITSIQKSGGHFKSTVCPVWRVDRDKVSPSIGTS